MAYGTDAGFLAYHEARGTDVTALVPDDIEAARLVASEWLDNRYRTSFPGLKVGARAQVREWPRTSAYDIYGDAISSLSVPVEIENATYEVALRQMLKPGSLSVDWTPGKYERVSVDGAVSVTYASFASVSDVQTRYAIIDQILSAILSGGNALSSGLSGSIARV